MIPLYRNCKPGSALWQLAVTGSRTSTTSCAPYPLAAQWLGMQHFPDPSSIHRFWHALDSPQRRQLESISEQLLQRFGLCRQSERVDLDLDSTGWMVYGRQFDGSRKGYFPRQRGRRGYRLSIASTRHSAGSEILSVCFDPANIPANGNGISQ